MLHPHVSVLDPGVNVQPSYRPARRGAGKPRMMRSASSRRISEEELKARNEKFWQDLPLPPALKTPAAAWIIGLTALALAIASVAYRDLLG